MQNNHPAVGRNLRAESTSKRCILRTIRLFFLQGWAWYRGNCKNTIDCLAAYFSWTDIEVIQRKFVARRTSFFERDRHFHLRRRDGQIHLDRLRQHLMKPCLAHLVKCKSLSWSAIIANHWLMAVRGFRNSLRIRLL